MSPDDPSPSVACSACRGTGRVISNLGGTRHEIPCPWCEGGGRRLPGHDAQHQNGGNGPREPEPEPPPAAA